MINSFDWQEFLSFARNIFNTHQNAKVINHSIESDCRIAISRAYYAVYHATKDYIYKVQPDFKPQFGEATHEAVINELKRKKNNKILRNISIPLSKLRDMRVRADYNSDRYDKRGESGNIIMELQKALNYADEINKKLTLCQQETQNDVEI